MIIGGGGRFFFYDDKDEFRQNTTAGDMSSTADGFSLFGEIGYRILNEEKVSFDIFAGIELMVQSQRSIDNCADCFSEEIDIDSGPYLSPKLNVHLTERWFIGINYVQHISGDLENVINASAGRTF